MAKKYQAFKGLNLNGARSENETREEYKKRQKQNKQALKLYNKVGREMFQEMFPEGIKYEMFAAEPEEKLKVSNKKLGEAK